MSFPEQAREFATEVVQKLQSAGFTALWAGGCVRDLQMGRHPQDYDVATSAKPDEVRQLFGRRKTIAVGESFGVVIVLGPRIDDEYVKVEVATFRSEGTYLDGRRPDPSQIRFTTPEKDAQRRDFTINGMFFDPIAGEVRDYVGGEADVRTGIVRAIGRPQDRMEEDKLRMLRAVRFAATLDFELDPATSAAVREMAPQLTVVSIERITQELRKMLVSPHRQRAIRLSQQLDLLPVMLPEIAELATADDPGSWTHVLDMLDQLEQPSFELTLATLLQSLPASGGGGKPDRDRSGTAAGVTRRLRLSNDEGERVVWLVGNQQSLVDAPQLPLAKLKRVLAHPLSAELVKFVRADISARRGDPAALEFVERFLDETPAEVIDPPPLVTGSDLIELGLKPGPAFQSLLERIRDEQLEGRVTSKSEAIAVVRSWL